MLFFQNKAGEIFMVKFSMRNFGYQDKGRIKVSVPKTPKLKPEQKISFSQNFAFLIYF